MFEAGELVMLPVPFSDLSSTKRRPVLVLTAPDQQGDFVASPVPSRSGCPNARRLAPEDLAAGTLSGRWGRWDKILTLHTARVLRRFGCVADESGSLFRRIRDNRTGNDDCSITVEGVYNILRFYSAALGFEIGATAPTDALDHEADIARVQEWLGHANICTTRIYYHRRTRPEDTPPFKVVAY